MPAEDGATSCWLIPENYFVSCFDALYRLHEYAIMLSCFDYSYICQTAKLHTSERDYRENESWSKSTVLLVFAESTAVNDAADIDTVEAWNYLSWIWRPRCAVHPSIGYSDWLLAYRLYWHFSL